MRIAKAMGLLCWLAIFSGFWPAGVIRAQTGLPDQAAIDGMPANRQSFNLSCEARSAVDWAAFWGVQIGERKFLKNLPRSDDPDSGFVGDPRGLWGSTPPLSYGVHASPVASLLRQYGLNAQARKNLAWDELRAEIAAGRPAIVWVIFGMASGAGIPYTATNGNQTLVAAYEHTVILAGYSPHTVTVIDPYTGGRQDYPLRSFLASWSVLGNMAVTGGGTLSPAFTPTPALPAWPTAAVKRFLPFVWCAAPVAPPAARPATYTVKPGDYLIALAKRLGVDWQALAARNGLSYPYTLHAGQILQIP